jgi:hypothetical protein
MPGLVHGIQQLPPPPPPPPHTQVAATPAAAKPVLPTVPPQPPPVPSSLPTAPLTVLPPEVWHVVIQHIALADLVTLSEVSKYLYAVSHAAPPPVAQLADIGNGRLLVPPHKIKRALQQWSNLRWRCVTENRTGAHTNPPAFGAVAITSPVHFRVAATFILSLSLGGMLPFPTLWRGAREGGGASSGKCVTERHVRH